MHIENAQIADVFLGFEDHGIFAFSMGFRFPNAYQSFGAYAIQDEKGVNFIKSILKALRVDSVDKLEGEYVRVKRPNSATDPIVAIGHIVEDSWVVLKDVYRQ